MVSIFRPASCMPRTASLLDTPPSIRSNIGSFSNRRTIPTYATMSNSAWVGSRLELVALGEVLVELSADRSGEISRGTTWQTSWAGDVVNTLFYAARSGLRTGLVTRFGSDPFTQMITDGIASERIDLTCSTIDPDRPNGLYFIMRDDEGERRFHYRRSNSAARSMLEGDSVEFERIADYLGDSRMILVTGVTLAIVRNRDRLFDLLSDVRRRFGTTIALDPNLRPLLWDSAGDMRRSIERLLPAVDIFLPSEPDLELLRDRHQSIEGLIDALPVQQIVLKQGARGATLFHQGTVYEAVPEVTSQAVDTTGAGDALNGRYLAGIIRGEEPSEALRQGVATAGRVVGVVGAIDPTYSSSLQTGT